MGDILDKGGIFRFMCTLETNLIFDIRGILNYNINISTSDK